jgi:hypothetical protein
MPAKRRSEGASHSSPQPLELGPVSDALVERSREASKARQFEVAYHTLAAALHVAEAETDVDRLETVVKESRRQQQLVDKAGGIHRVASQPGAPGLFESLALLAQAALVRRKGVEAVQLARAITQEHADGPHAPKHLHLARPGAKTRK